MSHQRYPSLDPVKEPHAISLKVLRLSRPSLVPQHPLPPTATPTPATTAPAPASLAYAGSPAAAGANPSPFLLSPVLNLPPSFGSAYVGETFSCTLCANHETAPSQPGGGAKSIRDVRIEAEMKTPAAGAGTRLPLYPPEGDEEAGTDLGPDRQTLQRIVSFDLKDEGNHVLGVTVSYYEATETSGRTRTFRKLYQFICKPSLVVRTKASPLPALRPAQQQPTPPPEGGDGAEVGEVGEVGRRRWVLEAQLENCSEEAMELERVVLDLEPELSYRDCNWEASGSAKPVLHPLEVEQVCFVVEEVEAGTARAEEGRILFGVLGIGWRGEMGSKGWLATGKLGARPM